MKCLVVLLCLLSAVGVSARQITLESALQIAEEHSHNLKATRANLNAAEQTVTAARSECFPTLSLDARAGYVDDIPSLDLSLPGLPPISQDLGSNDSYQTDLRLSVPLYTGGRISSAIKQAESGRDYRQALELVELDNLYLATRIEFLQLCQANKLREAVAASERRIQILRDGVTARLEAGVADSVDLLEVRLAAAQVETRSNQAATAVRSAEIRLLARLGLPDNEQLEPVVTLTDPRPYEVSTTTPTDTLPRLRAAAAMISREQATLDSRRAAFYPTLGVYAGYLYGKPNTNPFADEFNDSYTFGAQLQWSLNLGGGNTARRNSAAHTLESARQQHYQLSETLKREARLAFEQWQLSLSNFTTAQDERNIARDNFRLAQAQHDNGSIISNRLLEIENSLAEAEARLAATRVDFYVAQSIYFYTVGDDRLRKGL
ncbi:MAG: TolC family protein [candidate division Zixibacteria bacterium]|nr:TolC family protein [candidate division Zixibacteria bacterium]